MRKEVTPSLRSTIAILFFLPMLAACQTAGEKHVPCPTITSYAEGDSPCGPALAVNETFAPILGE